MTTKNDLPTTEDYVTQIGYSETIKRDIYQIVNRTTGVIEWEHPSLPLAKHTIFDMQEFLNSVEEMKGAPEEQFTIDGGDEDTVTPFRRH